MSIDEPQDEANLENEDELFEHHRIVCDKAQSPMRIDKYLMERIPNTTRTRIQFAIESESVKVNDKISKASYKVKPLDVITLSLPHPPRTDVLVAEDIPLNIVYEDKDILLVNKEAGMVVHPAHGNWNGTLVNALVYHFEQLPTHRNGEIRPGLVHRIDKDTSGLLIIAKSDFAMSHLAQQFFDHSIERTYYALVWGNVEKDAGTIKSYIGRSQKDRKVMDTYPDETKGKWAVTHYKVLKRFQYVTLIQCNLETGRTHQIRIHMKSIGHPLFSDAAYGGDKMLKGPQTGAYKHFVQSVFDMIPRQALHAKTLGIVHPISKQFLQFDTELPNDFTNAILAWEKFVATLD
jgi:23S rRNA pseudouridine1911/1915/1917 synthase